MNSPTPTTGSDDGCILTTTRRLPVPPELVFRAYREPELLARWWGPNGFRNEFHEFNFQPGGAWRCDMIGPDGARFANRSVFEEVSAGRIVLRHLDPVHEFTLTMTMDAEAGGTRLTWRMAFASAAECDRVRGFVPRCNEENFDRLEAVLGRLNAGERELALTRIIAATPRQLYRAWTEPELLKQWFCPKPWTVPVAELDVRPGGSAVIVMRGPDGTEVPHRGVYLEVVPDERLVYTSAFTRAWEPAEMPAAGSGCPLLTTLVTFEALGENRTRYTARARHWSAADCTAHEQMGFHEGWGICAEQLAELAARL